MTSVFPAAASAVAAISFGRTDFVADFLALVDFFVLAVFLALADFSSFRIAAGFVAVLFFFFTALDCETASGFDGLSALVFFANSRPPRR